jgi:hypothetical protein
VKKNAETDGSSIFLCKNAQKSVLAFFYVKNVKKNAETDGSSIFLYKNAQKISFGIFLCKNVKKNAETDDSSIFPCKNAKKMLKLMVPAFFYVKCKKNQFQHFFM